MQKNIAQIRVHKRRPIQFVRLKTEKQDKQNFYNFVTNSWWPN